MLSKAKLLDLKCFEELSLLRSCFLVKLKDEELARRLCTKSNQLETKHLLQLLTLDNYDQKYFNRLLEEVERRLPLRSKELIEVMNSLRLRQVANPLLEANFCSLFQTCYSKLNGVML